MSQHQNHHHHHQQQMQQLELHLQQQHIQEKQQQQPLQASQQQLLLQQQPLREQQQSWQAQRAQFLPPTTQAIYYTEHHYPASHQSNSSSFASAAPFVSTKTNNNYLPAAPSANRNINNNNNYQPTITTTSSGHFFPSQPDYYNNIHHNNNNNNTYCTSSSSSSTSTSLAAPYQTYTTTTTTTTPAHPTHSTIVSVPTVAPQCNIYNSQQHYNSYQQPHNNHLNHISNHLASNYKPRNSTVFRHQYFQPFYATIQQNSNNYQLYQQRRQSHQLALMSTSASASTITTTTANIESGPKLIWLLFMHRHGDRTPLNMAPRDKYNSVMYWPEGFGNLDNFGRQRMYKLGKFIRRRYDDFLTDNIREIYSRSSDVDRCIESSHAVLAGLYPPSERFEWNKNLAWVPAPVHTVPAPEDYLLNEAGRKFLIDVINEIHLIQNSDAVKKLYQDSVKERELMERELGYQYDMFWKFKATYSTLDIEERNGLAMPAWYTPELKEKLYRFAGIAFGLAGGGTEKLKKLRCGHLLNDIVSRMEMASIEGPKLRDESEFLQPTNSPTGVDDRKIVHYSTHDSIMAAFLEALNINTPMPIPPGFGATFFIELYVDLDERGLPVSEKYIKLFYMDDTDSEKPIEKKLPNCQLNERGQVTLNNFKAYIGHLLTGNSTCNLWDNNT